MTDLDALQAEFPCYYVRIGGFFATIWDDGSGELYSDGDIRIPLATMEAFARMAHKFMYFRENRDRQNGN